MLSLVLCNISGTHLESQALLSITVAWSFSCSVYSVESLRRCEGIEAFAEFLPFSQKEKLWDEK